MAQFEKGKSGNPKGRPRQTTGSVLETGFFNLSVPEQPTERRVTDPDYTGATWQRFGSDNLFPLAISALNRQSTAHRAILRNKAKWTTGKGLVVHNENEKLKALVNRANNRGENLSSIARKIFYEKYGWGNAYLQIVTDPKRSFLSFYHIDTMKCRVNKPGDGIVQHPDWSRVENHKNLLIDLPLYPMFERVDGLEYSMIHFKDYEPGFDFYGVPGWIAAMDSAAIAYKTNKWNISRLDNSFQSSGVLLVEGNLSQADAKKLKKEFKSEFIGEGKNGKVFFITKQLGGGQTTFTPFQNSHEGDWNQLHKQSEQDIITAHNWFPALSGLAQAGSLGNTQQIRNEYQIALNSVISDEQTVFLEKIQEVIGDLTSLDTSDLGFSNKMPLSFLDKVDLNRVIKIGEARRELGLEVDDADVTNEQYIIPSSTPLIELKEGE